jgi:hypothetical protein
VGRPLTGCRQAADRPLTDQTALGHGTRGSGRARCDRAAPWASSHRSRWRRGIRGRRYDGRHSMTRSETHHRLGEKEQAQGSEPRQRQGSGVGRAGGRCSYGSSHSKRGLWWYVGGCCASCRTQNRTGLAQTVAKFSPSESDSQSKSWSPGRLGRVITEFALGQPCFTRKIKFTPVDQTFASCPSSLTENAYKSLRVGTNSGSTL